MSRSSNPPFGGTFPGGHGPVIVPLSTVVSNAIQALITSSSDKEEDAFAKAFDNTFSHNIKTIINGQTKTREELRDFILQIRGSIGNESVQFTQLIEHQTQEGSETSGEVGTFFTWEGYRPFLVLGAPMAVKASVSLQASVRNTTGGLLGRHITNLSVVAQQIPVPITLPGQPAPV